jgi:hypothetical protein
LEQALSQWGPAGVILTVLIVIIKWFMTHIDNQATTQKEMVESFNLTIQEHLIKSTEAMTETKNAICELKRYLVNTNGHKDKVVGS